MSILDSIRIDLTEFHIKKIQEIDNFDYSNTLKKVNHDLGGGLTKEYLLSGLENLKRYYIVALLDPANQHAVSAMVDPFWHSHVLHTKEYFDFTSSVFDQYIHHAPLDPDDKEEVDRITELYKYTLNVYSKIFKDVNEEWWPKVTGSNIGPVICYHQFISNTEVLKHSLFDSRDGVTANFLN
jgi:hypothetical protein